MDDKQAFILYEAWSDSWENVMTDAFGYKIIGIALEEEDAKDWVKKGHPITQDKYGWAADIGSFSRKYKTFNLIKE